MSRYKDLIQNAKKPDNQNTNNPESKITNEPTNQKSKKSDSHKSGQTKSQPDSQIVEIPEVNLCIKVPKNLRQHWSAEAKRQGTTLKAVISQALEDEFGLPE
jgi:hypothetical protein